MRNGLIRLGRAALCVAACFGVGAFATNAAAAPTLPTIVAGDASFSQTGNVFSITNTPGAIINWQSFSVNAGEVTRFIQQNADSAVLNRIVGQDPSRILGALQSNGKVFLINPNGVVFGPDARVDVNGLVASTLNMSDADFLAGKKNFTAGLTAGSVRNEGAITTPGGGKVFLVAPNVENSGVITAPNGEVVLAAGRSVQLVDSANPDLSVVVSAPNDAAINLGQVVSNGGRIGIYGALVNQRGVVNANSAVVGQDGRIVLKASKDALLDAGSVTSAHSVRAEAGNELTIRAAVSSADGDIDLRANSHIALLAGGSLASPNYIDLKSEKMTLAGSIGGVAADGVLPVVSFNAFDNSTGIAVTSGDAGAALTLDPGRLGAFEAYEINIGNSGHTGDIAILDALTLAGNLVIDTAGRIDLNAPVVLEGATSQFLATLHAPGRDFRVTSNSAINATRKIGVAGAGRILIDGKLTSGDIALGAGSGGIELTADVTAGSRATLRTDGTLGQGNAIVKTPALLVEAANVNMLGNNEVGTLAGAATGTSTGAGVGFRFRWVDGLRIGSVADRAGLASKGEITLTGGDLTADATIDAATAIVVEAASIKGSGTLKSNVLSLQSRGGIGERTRALNTSANVLLKAKNTFTGAGTGTAPINIVNDRALSIGSVVQDGAGNGGAISIESSGGLTVSPTGAGQQGVSTGSGDISLVTHSPLTILGKVSTDSGNVTLLADNGGLLTIGANGQVASSSGNVRITAGETAIAPGSIVVSSPDKLAVTTTIPPTNPEPEPPRPTPPLDTCLANPDASGCSAVLEGATRTCMANPDGPQCSQVLPPVDTCRSNPAKLGCTVVMQREEIRQCIAAPKAPGCAAILPPYPTCEQLPATYGCAPVIAEREAIAQCIASPKAPGCGATLPPYDTCAVSPSTYGCAPVIAEHDAIAACIATPKAPGCGATLPAYDICEKSPNTYGCAPVIAERNAIAACIATPKGPGCAITLPAYDICAVSPDTYGCAPVIAERNAIAACIATPKAPGCGTTLPAYDACEKTPGIYGCAPVIAERNAVTACIAAPTAPGCGDTLPPLASCRLDAGLYGCAPVLERAEFLACVASPGAPGCAARLPALAICKATPGIEGCAQVIELTFNACLLNKADPSCAGILPTIAQCESNKAMAGCDVVLPTMQACIVGPTQPGCSVRLPKLEQCAVNPNQAGCEAVLPKPDFCSTHPLDARCVVFNPAPVQGGGESKKPVAEVVQNTVALINTRTPAQEKLPPGPAGAGNGSGNSGGTTGGESGGAGGDAGGGTPAEQSENQSGPAAGTNTGVKNEKPATKMYCN